MNMMTQGNRQSQLPGALLAASIPGLAHYEASALSSLIAINRFVGRNVQVAAEAERTDKLRVFVSGWAMKSVGISGQRRQIIGFVLPGNIEGLHTDFHQTATSDVTTLTSCEIAEFRMNDVLALLREFPGIGAGFRAYMAREAAYLGDQVLRLGRMTAYERVCHFMLEISDRQTAARANQATVAFPITQSIVADALGLSVVHVNRQVMRLRQEGLLDLDRKSLTINDADALRRISGYKSRTLEMETAPSYAGAAE